MPGGRGLNTILCILIAFWNRSTGKASLIFRTFSMFVLVACTNNFSGLLAFDFAMVTALSWKGMGGGIFWILPPVSLL